MMRRSLQSSNAEWRLLIANAAGLPCGWFRFLLRNDESTLSRWSLDLPPANPMTSGRSARAVFVVKSRNFRWASQRDSARVRHNETDQRRHRSSFNWCQPLNA
jgi:hypothetical protein